MVRMVVTPGVRMVLTEEASAYWATRSSFYLSLVYTGVQSCKNLLTFGKCMFYLGLLYLNKKKELGRKGGREGGKKRGNKTGAAINVSLVYFALK